MLEQNRDKMITVFTPTYNRSHVLVKLYDSLEKQTSKNFEWLIVDDGSTDDTVSLIKQLQKTATFCIRYYYKKNEGKHIAINEGVKLANGKFFFIVDSDDWLTENAIEKVDLYCIQINNSSEFAGVVGLRGKDIKHVIKTPTESIDIEEYKLQYGEYIDATSVDLRYQYNITGDRAEVIKTEILKKFDFPQIDDEKFLAEDYLWLKISNAGYKFRWFNEIIYITEYMEEGLTNNIRSLVKRNWRGHIICANNALQTKGIPLKDKLRLCVRYYRYGMYGKMSLKTLYRECNFKIWSVFCILVALLWKVRD